MLSPRVALLLFTTMQLSGRIPLSALSSLAGGDFAFPETCNCPIWSCSTTTFPDNPRGGGEKNQHFSVREIKKTFHQS